MEHLPLERTSILCDYIVMYTVIMYVHYIYIVHVSKAVMSSITVHVTKVGQNHWPFSKKSCAHVPLWALLRTVWRSDVKRKG